MGNWDERIKLFIPPIAIEGAKRIFQRGNIRLHRLAVGGMWDKVGKLQFDFLTTQGLKPEHKFLDVGCGSLRGGIHFIRYLDTGNYYGIDNDKFLLDCGRKIKIPEQDLENKNPCLKKLDDFNFSSLNSQFDYALAQSVFTHLPLNKIIR